MESHGILKGRETSSVKYQNLYDELTDLILSEKQERPDGRFLSEREISARFNVSRSTVRRAVAELCKQGYLVQIHGSGTFIKNRQQSHSIYSMVRCAQNYEEMGLHPSRAILCQKIIPANFAVAENLKINIDEPVLLLNILYYADRVPLNQTISYLPLSRFPGVERLDFSKTPLLELLQSHYQAEPRRTDNTLEAILPPNQVAEKLKIKPTVPIILFESVTLGLMEGVLLPMEYFKCYYKTDSLRFSFTHNHVLL